MATAEQVELPFDPDTQALFCSWCGSRLEQSGHLFSEFMLCPLHGEFTLAPLVMRVPLQVLGNAPSFDMVPNDDPNAGKWFLHVSQTDAGMISNIQAIDARRKAHPEDRDICGQFDPRRNPKICGQYRASVIHFTASSNHIISHAAHDFVWDSRSPREANPRETRVL